MVQMTIADQQIIKAIPGNNICADCPTKSPQWASLSFGVLVCLECSGKHRCSYIICTISTNGFMDRSTNSANERRG